MANVADALRKLVPQNAPERLLPIGGRCLLKRILLIGNTIANLRT
jgi:hypothetical protein